MYKFYSILRFFLVLLSFIKRVKLMKKTENIEMVSCHFLVFMCAYSHSADNTIAVRQGEKLLLVQEKHISKQENFRLTSHLMYLLSCH